MRPKVTELLTFVEINNGNANEDEGKDNSDQPNFSPLLQVLFSSIDLGGCFGDKSPK